eukprot:530510_1
MAIRILLIAILFISAYAASNEHRLKIMEYFIKRGSIASPYLITLTDALIENGQIMIHSGNYRAFGKTKGYSTWSCCYTYFRESGMNRAEKMVGPMAAKELTKKKSKD